MTTEYIVGLTYADRLRLATESRYAAIKGCLHSDISALTSLLGPMSDGPEWPAAAAWLATWHGTNACIISDGLSDPWVERNKPETGLGIEVFIESPDVALSKDAAQTTLADTWLFPMLAEISHTLAGYPRLSEKLLAGELLSLELNIDPIKDGRGQAGVLLNIQPNFENCLQLPGGKVLLIAATLITTAELRFLRGKGVNGRQQLADLLQTSGFGHVSYLNRPSLL